MKETKKKWKKPKDSSFIHLFVHPFTGPLNLIINEKKKLSLFYRSIIQILIEEEVEKM